MVRSGARKGRRTLVVHVKVDDCLVRDGGPRLGLIVSKAVGDSVTRHRVSRRLRHIAMSEMKQRPDDLLVVVRALAPAAAASSEELRGEFSAALAGAERRARRSVEQVERR